MTLLFTEKSMMRLIMPVTSGRGNDWGGTDLGVTILPPLNFPSLPGRMDCNGCCGIKAPAAVLFR